MKGIEQAYKLARPDGYDFYTGKTINYRKAIGQAVKPPNANKKLGICSSGVLHASKQPLDCFVGASIPCSAYRVEGIPCCGNAEKWGFIELKILEEITNLDELLGFKYTEACNPINPLKRKRKPTHHDIELLAEWDSVGDGVWDSVGDSVRASVWASVWASVGASVWDCVRASVGASVRASVRDGVWDSIWTSVSNSVGDSVRASVWAYIGSLLPNVKQWKYVAHGEGEYPFQPAVDLWKRGFVPSFDGTTWRLHSGKKAEIVFSMQQEVKE